MTLRDFMPPILYKLSAVTRNMVLLTVPGQPVWTPRNFEQLSKEGYEKSATVYACINTIAKGIGGLSWLLYRRRGSRPVEIDEHALLDLLARPNPREGQGFFFEKATGYLMLSGNSYIERAGPKTGPPKELYALRPDRMTVLPHPVDYVGGYRYRAGANQQDFDAAHVMHLKLWHPTNDWYGLSPIGAAAMPIDTDNAAQTWNYSLLKNSARKSGAFVVAGNLNDEQFTRHKKQIADETGPSRAGAPLLLEGGADWKEMGLSPKDMDFIEARKMSKSDIAMAFAVPAELIGLKEATFENRKEARKAFYTEAVLPLASFLRDELNVWLTPLYGDTLSLDFDRDAIDALQEDREKVWTRVKGADWLTINEKRDGTGYDDYGPAGDVILVGAMLLPLGADAGAINEDGGQSRRDSDPRTDLKAFNLTNEKQKAAHWKSTDRLRASWTLTMRKAVARRFTAEARAVTAAMRTASGPAQAEPAALAAIDAQRGEWLKLYGVLYLAVGGSFARRTWQGLKDQGEIPERMGTGGDSRAAGDGRVRKDEGDEPWMAAIREWVKRRGGPTMTDVLATTKKQIRGSLADGLEAGETLDELTQRVEDFYLEDIIPFRSTLIARTETHQASGLGSRAAAEATGLELRKEWIAVRDTRTRDAHAEMDGAQKGLDEPYEIGRDRLMFPGDSSLGASAANTIQCRCTEGYHTVRE